jgi:GIGANTEA protein
MSASNGKWIDGLQFSSLFWPPPHDAQQKQAQTLAYVEYFGQFTSDSEQFPEDVAQLIQSCYPSKEKRLVDEVLGNI